MLVVEVWTWHGLTLGTSSWRRSVSCFDQSVSEERSKTHVYSRAYGVTRGVYPAPADVFNFTKTPLRDVKVVILGQDPYHQPGQAHGLAFSVPEGVAVPPSLRNILCELADDISDRKHANGTAKSVPYFGDLTPWTRQGVLLFNTALTVRRNEAGSHCDIWQPFTDEVIRAVCDSATVAPHFILWGAKVKKALERVLGRLVQCNWSRDVVGLGHWNPGIAARLITATYSAHPSPLSADKGFFGARPFSRANLALTLNNPGCAPVDWRLS